jgi:hypothetical protein
MFKKLCKWEKKYLLIIKFFALITLIGEFFQRFPEHFPRVLRWYISDFFGVGIYLFSMFLIFKDDIIFKKIWLYPFIFAGDAILFEFIFKRKNIDLIDITIFILSAITITLIGYFLRHHYEPVV